MKFADVVPCVVMLFMDVGCYRERHIGDQRSAVPSKLDIEK